MAWIAHYGIKGQKWGVRRWQNEDGTLNAAGKERYGVSDNDLRDQEHLRKIGSEVSGRDRGWEHVDIDKKSKAELDRVAKNYYSNDRHAKSVDQARDMRSGFLKNNRQPLLLGRKKWNEDYKFFTENFDAAREASDAVLSRELMTSVRKMPKSVQRKGELYAAEILGYSSGDD